MNDDADDSTGDTAAALFVLLSPVSACLSWRIFWHRPRPARRFVCRSASASHSGRASISLVLGRSLLGNRHGPPRNLKIEPDEPPKKFKGDPVFNQIRAEAPELKDVTWYGRRPFDQAQAITPPLVLMPEVLDPPEECCWPPLSEFEQRFVGVR
jgi:hypothetical protein